MRRSVWMCPVACVSCVKTPGAIEDHARAARACHAVHEPIIQDIPTIRNMPYVVPFEEYPSFWGNALICVICVYISALIVQCKTNTVIVQCNKSKKEVYLFFTLTWEKLNGNKGS
ncbi:hypothetical protein GXY_00813 [Novacetimonas hansenii ATCC 23769]|uniref:Uncharacterized protein n=1 Tax=Novacetimonas hansenii ATCC 23769 TaxID=714995 RepID=D5QAP2_NOVHA|nr:hypothetical protein GXY_00813 [Novacetimonas hansenii ATCC 23769]